MLNSITRRGEHYLPGPRARRHAKQADVDEVVAESRRERRQQSVLISRSSHLDLPYAREVGHVGEAAGVATSAGVMEGHNVPPDVLTGVVQWLLKGGHDPVHHLDAFRIMELEGGKYCFNDGCEVVGHLKDFKVCPQCKTARYCGDACQKQDWNAGGHKATCGTVASKVSQTRAPAQ